VGGLAHADKVLDVRGWSGPWVILKAKSELNLMEPGQVLEVLVTDPMTLVDFPNVFGQSNHQLIHINEASGFTRLYVRRGYTDKSSELATARGGVTENQTKRR
jgi:tRNA 2-thiouridine synthesizing protein A